MMDDIGDTAGQLASEDEGGHVYPTGRDHRGRFAPGWKGGPGRPKASFTRELARQVDMPSIVRRLLDVIADDRTGKREVLQAIQLLAAYNDGRPVSRIQMRETASALPRGFDALPLDVRVIILRDMRASALAGHVPDEEDDDDE